MGFVSLRIYRSLTLCARPARLTSEISLEELLLIIFGSIPTISSLFLSQSQQYLRHASSNVNLIPYERAKTVTPNPNRDLKWPLKDTQRGQGFSASI